MKVGVAEPELDTVVETAVRASQASGYNCIIDMYVLTKVQAKASRTVPEEQENKIRIHKSRMRETRSITNSVRIGCFGRPPECPEPCLSMLLDQSRGVVKAVLAFYSPDHRLNPIPSSIPG